MVISQTLTRHIECRLKNVQLCSTYGEVYFFKDNGFGRCDILKFPGGRSSGALISLSGEWYSVLIHGSYTAWSTRIRRGIDPERGRYIYCKSNLVVRIYGD